MKPDTVIVICPCCASVVEASPDEYERHFDCIHCGQEWVMTVDARRYQEHALQ